MKLFLLFVVGLSLTEQASTQDSCGQRFLVGPPAESRIVGGLEAPEGAWPWQVSIQIYFSHHCSGTILNNLWVLTAGHCFSRILNHFSLRYLHVVAGLSMLSTPGEYVQIHPVSEIKIHKDFDEESGDYDVALLLLVYPLKFTDHVQPICTPDSVTHEFLFNFTNCFITGWGSMFHKGPPVNTLQEAEVELIDTGTCNLDTWYSGLITENMICAGLKSGGVDTCQGDSGGPLQCYSEDEERFYVVGVTSFGDGCGLRFRPGVYARTTRFSDWIKETQEDVSVMSGHKTERTDMKLVSVLLILVLKLL
ncbi:acrosin [Sphaeramia orbicularis]|uniref:acrosin n=1 Tax=Sphaeramia orbicularis TaxID=375764 RepID=UPI00117C235E|nr:acrosin-like [Sphaeramia orbicularis]